MSVTSLQFMLFVALSVIIYYLVPKRFQWGLLLIYSAAFFIMSTAAYTAVYLVISVLSTHFCSVKIQKAAGEGNEKESKRYLLLGILINVAILAVLKYSNFIIVNFNLISRILPVNFYVQKTNFLAPIGLSFYTLSIVGYLLDCYWGICEPNQNLFKTALFIGYFPQLTSGPITRYSQVENQLFSAHTFSFQQIQFGMQRILWGLFKKLVISAKVSVIVDTIYAHTQEYHGFYIWIAAGLFMVQLYTDFSGCMDIILGVSELYGVALPENFRTPFFSTSVQEYWQRWHITLGAWLKDYVLYPILRTAAWKNLTKWTKKVWGKKAAKQIPSYLGMLCVWLLIGLWHGGGWKYILGMGIWFWLCIVLAQVLEPLFKRVNKVLQINTDSFSWHLLRSIGVFILAAIGNIFFRLPSLTTALSTIKLGFSELHPTMLTRMLIDGSILKLGATKADICIILGGIIALFVVDGIQVKCGSAREWMSKQFLLFRWLIWLLLLFATILFGAYGPGVDASEFIYQMF